MRRIGLAVAVVVVVLAALLAWLAFGRSTVRATSSVDADVTIECSGATGVSSDACHAWGDEILAQGAPSHTFEMKDLAVLRLDRDLLGFGACRVSYFIERYTDEPAWREETACR